MTAFKMCPKYAAISEVLSKSIPDTETNLLFISFDNVLSEITYQWKDIGYQSLTNKAKVTSDVVQFVVELVSHFKQYFKDYTIILYHTDVESEPELFKNQMSDQGKREYRLNYVSRLNTIKYRDFKKLYVESLYPLIETVIHSVPNVHIIKTKNIDSTLVPYAFATTYPDRKIVVMTWDNVDVLLEHMFDNVFVIYDARNEEYMLSPTVGGGKNYIDMITNALNPMHYGKFATRVIAAAVGNYPRSLYGIGHRKVGYDMVAQWLQAVFGNTQIPADYSDYTVLLPHMKADMRDGFSDSFLGMDLEMQYQMLLDDEKTDILYKLDHNPVDPKEIMKLFPNMVVEWDRLYT